MPTSVVEWSATAGWGFASVSRSAVNADTGKTCMTAKPTRPKPPGGAVRVRSAEPAALQNPCAGGSRPRDGPGQRAAHRYARRHRCDRRDQHAERGPGPIPRCRPPSTTRARTSPAAAGADHRQRRQPLVNWRCGASSPGTVTLVLVRASKGDRVRVVVRTSLRSSSHASRARSSPGC